MRRYVIVGNSAGAVGAIEAIRRIDSSGTITVVSEEDSVAYSRPAISELLCGAKDFDSIVYRPARFYEQARAETLFGVRVAGVDLKSRQVVLEDGRSLA